MKDNWKQILKQLKLENIKKAAPGFFEASGGYSMKVNPYTDKTANGLTKCVIDFLTFSGHYANRINVQGTPRVEKIKTASGFSMDKLTFTPSTTNKGTADIHSIINGKPVSIEIKIGADKQSEHQRKEQARIEQAGGIYLIVKDFPTFHNWYTDFLN